MCLTGRRQEGGPMRRFGVLAAAILAACLFLVPVAHAECVPGDGDCPLEPPPAEQVTPDPGLGASLRPGEGVEPGSAAPVVMAMPLPRVVQVQAEQGDRPSAPVDRLPVPVGSQGPPLTSDVTR